MGSHEASFDIEPSRAAVSAFADQLAEFCDAQAVPSAVLNAFQVALDDVLTNIIDYSAPNAPVSTIRAHVSVMPDGLQVTVEDDGIAFDPLSAAEPNLDLDLDDRPIGGLGIHLVKTLMDGPTGHLDLGRLRLRP